MWDYIAQTRQNDLRREAAARRLVRFARAERRQTLIQAFRLWSAKINIRLQPHHHTPIQPLISVSEMQSCVDA